MANLKYLMQGFHEDVNFCDEIIEILKCDEYNKIYVLTAFVNDTAIYNLEKEIEVSEADIIFIVGVRNNVTTYQGLKRLLNSKACVYTFDTARNDSIFHVKTVMAVGHERSKVICGSANITTGGLANNVEAGLVTDLDYQDKEDKALSIEINNYITSIISDYPENVKKIDADYLEVLRKDGLVVDEDKTPNRNNAKVDGSTDGKISIVSKFPLKNKKMKFPRRNRKQMEAIYRKVEEITVEEICLEVWKSKPLKKTHLGIANNENTNPKGEMGLGKGKYNEIDPFSYFRDLVFKDIVWKKNKKGDETGEAKFTLIINGINYGMYLLELLHKRQGMVAYEQNNYVTSIRWGECSQIIKNKALIGKELTLLKSESGDYFLINIE